MSLIFNHSITHSALNSAQSSNSLDRRVLYSGRRSAAMRPLANSTIAPCNLPVRVQRLS